MDNELKLGTLKQKYNIALLVLAGVLIGSMLWLSLRPTEWAFVLLPLLGGVATALLWLAVARFFLCRDAGRLLAPSFKTPLKLAMLAPVWLVCTMALLTVPSDTSGWNEDLASALALLVTLLCALVFVVGVPVLGGLSVYKAVRHKAGASPAETPAYRNGPLVAAIVLLVLTLGGLGISFLVPFV